MMLFGVNFNIYFLLLIRKFRAAFTNSEFLGYFGHRRRRFGAHRRGPSGRLL